MRSRDSVPLNYAHDVHKYSDTWVGYKYHIFTASPAGYVMWILRYHNGYELDSGSENPGSIPGRKKIHRRHPALFVLFGSESAYHSFLFHSDSISIMRIMIMWCGLIRN